MKIQIKALLLMIAVFCGKGLFAQTIGLNGPTGVIQSGSIVTFEAIGETANKRIVTVSAVPATTHYNVGAQIWATKYFPQDSQPGKFQYKIENSVTTQMSVKLTISTTIIIISNGTISYEYKDFNFDIVVAPKSNADIQNNVIAFGTGDPNFFDDFTISGSTPTGGNGTYSYEWQLVNDDNSWSSSSSGTRSSLSSWEKDNSKEFRDVADHNLYLRRKITSGNVSSYSNKILIYDYTNANKDEIIVMVKGNVVKRLPGGGYENITDEVNLRFEPSFFLAPGIRDNGIPESTFRIANPVSGVRYRWFHHFYSTYEITEGITFSTDPFPRPVNIGARGIRIYGSDGSKATIVYQ